MMSSATTQEEERQDVASIMRSFSWGQNLARAQDLHHHTQQHHQQQQQQHQQQSTTNNNLQHTTPRPHQHTTHTTHIAAPPVHAVQQRAAQAAADVLNLPHDAAFAAIPSLDAAAQTAAANTAAAAAAALAAADAAASPGAKRARFDLPFGSLVHGGTDELNGLVVPGSDDAGEQIFTCAVCRKDFKREMNLIFHMTTHRTPKQPEPARDAEASSTVAVETGKTSAPVKCQDCGKEFATKYQAKKHYLRRHFQGEKPYACPKCKKKRFVVKEDLTMHMKSCGNVYQCKCGMKLCSLGALRRHCKYFDHEPKSEKPENAEEEDAAADPSAAVSAPAWPVAPHELLPTGDASSLLVNPTDAVGLRQPAVGVASSTSSASASGAFLSNSIQGELAIHRVPGASLTAGAIVPGEGDVVQNTTAAVALTHGVPAASLNKSGLHHARLPVGTAAEAVGGRPPWSADVKASWGGADGKVWSPEVSLPSIAHALRRAQAGSATDSLGTPTPPD